MEPFESARGLSKTGEHAMGGMEMTLITEPSGTGENAVKVIGGRPGSGRVGIPIRS